MHTPPANIKDFDRGVNPSDLYNRWDAWVHDQTSTSNDFPAWYESTSPPNGSSPATVAPPWQGLPRVAVVLNNNDIAAAAKVVDNPVEFGSGPDPLLVNQPPFLDSSGKTYRGLKYRPQDEYLEWVTLRDSDDVIREIWFTYEAPEYWEFIAAHDRDLLLTLYAEVTGISKTSIDVSKLYFQETLTHIEPFANGQKLTFPAGSYNPYNEYNLMAAVHLTQGANTLGAEIKLAMDGSLIWGTPPKTSDPDLICCASYGDPNRHSDPTIGKEVNDLSRKGMFVTLRDPVALYMASIRENDFTDWSGHPIPNLSSDYFVPVRKSDDGAMILRAVFKVPHGVNRNGKQARVGDLSYEGKPINSGGQVADAVTMNLFAQAIPGGPNQTSQRCNGHPCFDPRHPGYVILTHINKPCDQPTVELASHVAQVQALPRKLRRHAHSRLAQHV